MNRWRGNMRKIKESIEGDRNNNAVSAIHSMAEAINARIMKDLDIDEKDFYVCYTVYGLWVEFKMSDVYGISISYNTDHRDILIRSEEDHDWLNETFIELNSHPSRVASAVINLIKEDGYIEVG
jgi:hypothetical protein